MRKSTRVRLRGLRHPIWVSVEVQSNEASSPRSESEKPKKWTGLWKWLTGGAATLAFVVAAGFVVYEAAQPGYRFGSCNVAKTIVAKQGMTAEMMEDVIIGDMQAIEDQSLATKKRLHEVRGDEKGLDVALPHTSVSVPALVRLIRRTFGHGDTVITVDLLPPETGFYSAQVLIDRGEEGESTFASTVKAEDLGTVLQKAAAVTVGFLDPLALASFDARLLSENCDGDLQCVRKQEEALRLFNEAEKADDPEQRYGGLIGLSEVYSKRGQFDAAGRFAIAAAAQAEAMAGPHCAGRCDKKGESAQVLMRSALERDVVALLAAGDLSNAWAALTRISRNRKPIDEAKDPFYETNLAHYWLALGEKRLKDQSLDCPGDSNWDKPISACTEAINAFKVADGAFQLASQDYSTGYDPASHYIIDHDRAFALRDHGRLDDAIGYYESLLREAPADGTWLKDYANALSQRAQNRHSTKPSDYNAALEQFRLAIALLNEAATEQPRDTVAVQNLSDGYLDLAKTLAQVSPLDGAGFIGAMTNAAHTAPKRPWVPMEIANLLRQKDKAVDASQAARLSNELGQGQDPPQLCRQLDQLLSALAAAYGAPAPKGMPVDGKVSCQSSPGPKAIRG